jgi:hypothetical protein
LRQVASRIYIEADLAMAAEEIDESDAIGEEEEK